MHKYNFPKPYTFGMWLLYKKKYFINSGYLEFISDSIHDCIFQVHNPLISYTHG